MTLKLAIVGLLALGGAALSTGAASAMTIGPAPAADVAAHIDQVRWVCGPYRCWWRPNYYGYGPGVYGPGWGWHRGWHGRRW